MAGSMSGGSSPVVISKSWAFEGFVLMRETFLRRVSMVCPFSSSAGSSRNQRGHVVGEVLLAANSPVSRDGRQCSVEHRQHWLATSSTSLRVDIHHLPYWRLFMSRQIR